LQVHANLPAPMTVSYRKIRLEELDAKKTNKGRGQKKRAKAA
jgi:hypothetical protein